MDLEIRSFAFVSHDAQPPSDELLPRIRDIRDLEKEGFQLHYSSQSEEAESVVRDFLRHVKQEEEKNVNISLLAACRNLGLELFPPQVKAQEATELFGEGYEKSVETLGEHHELTRSFFVNLSLARERLLLSVGDQDSISRSAEEDMADIMISDFKLDDRIHRVRRPSILDEVVVPEYDNDSGINLERIKLMIVGHGGECQNDSTIVQGVIGGGDWRGRK